MARKKIKARRSNFSNWKWIIGLTGGLGTGKSTVLKVVKSKRIFTLDADGIVRDLLTKNRSVIKRIKRKFGPDVVSKTGKLNRKVLAQQIFSSRSKRRTLESILHPLVRKTMWKQLKRKKGKMAVCDVPLLYESGWDKFFDKTLVVSASLETRIRRLKKRGFSRSQSLERIKAQMALSKKVKKADFVINNNGSIRNTTRQVHRIIKTILNSHIGEE